MASWPIRGMPAVYQGRTLVVVLCMHRSGSSFTARLLQRLGMSLGPFELIGAEKSNPHGHFEAVPFVSLNRDLQFKALGFENDFSVDPVTLRRFLETGGEWPSEISISASQSQQGRQLIHQLVASGPVSGFKDPRTVLTWPFWRCVLQEFPGLRVVPLFLIRSPHEIAMSLFQRVHGNCRYDDALAVTAVHFRRMKGILDEWRGDRAVLQFEPQFYARQAPKAMEICGLKWDESIFSEAYDPGCRHHSPAIIVHEAQSLFEQMGGSEDRLAERENLHKLMADAALREQELRHRLTQTEDRFAAVQRQMASCQARLNALQAEKLVWDGYRRSRGWAALEAAWRLRLLLIPRRSRREDVARMPFRLGRALYRRVRGTVSWIRSVAQ